MLLTPQAIMAEHNPNRVTPQRNAGLGWQSSAATSALDLAPRRFRCAAAAIAILCSCMVLFAATLRVAHNHNTAEQRSGHCEICLSIHTGIPVAALPVLFTAQTAPDPVVTPVLQAPTLLRVDTRSPRAPPAA